MNANIFQIFHDEPVHGQSASGFESLDSTESQNPEWREYAAIRNFFLSHSIIEDELYGFFPSDFEGKTSLDAQAVRAFIHDNPGYEVYTFSPPMVDAPCYLNVFEQGNRIHPGFIEAAEAYLKAIPLEVDLRGLAMDSRSAVIGHYVVAKPSFWQTWFALTERLFSLLEQPESALRRRVDSLAVCESPLDIKDLLIERIASLVLSLCTDIKVCTFNALHAPRPDSPYHSFERQLSILGDLKSGYQKTEDKSYLDNFYPLRGAVLQSTEGARLARAKDGFLGTQLIASPDLLYVCFTHVTPPFQYPPYVNMLNLGEVQGPGKANLRDLAPEWEPWHPQLGSLAGCFALKNYIVENRLQVRQIGLCQYRKFVSNRRISGIPAVNYPLMDTVSSEMLHDAELHDLMLPGGRDYLLVKPGVLPGGYYNQYNVSHVAEDFLRFTSEAVELGVLDRGEVMTFFGIDAFMPGGIELGVFPAAFWIQAISSIEMVVRACVTRYPGRRSGYQTRNWAFCVERLGSFLLLKQMVANYGPDYWKQAFVGQLNLLTSSGQALYVGGT